MWFTRTYFAVFSLQKLTKISFVKIVQKKVLRIFESFDKSCWAERDLIFIKIKD
jgi:hypothetical protein